MHLFSDAAAVRSSVKSPSECGKRLQGCGTDRPSKGGFQGSGATGPDLHAAGDEVAGRVKNLSPAGLATTDRGDAEISRHSRWRQRTGLPTDAETPRPQPSIRRQDCSKPPGPSGSWGFRRVSARGATDHHEPL